MSIYRFARATVILGFLSKYRLKVFYMLTGVAVAFVTDWLYGDVASYLDVHSPQWALEVLVLKTVIVYASLCFLLWQIRPSEWQNQREPKENSELEGTASTSKLTKIAQKKTLGKRRNAILRK